MAVEVMMAVVVKVEVPLMVVLVTLVPNSMVRLPWALVHVILVRRLTCRGCPSLSVRLSLVPKGS